MVEDKMSKLKPKFGNNKCKNHLRSAPQQANLASYLYCFLADKVWWKSPNLRTLISELITNLHLE